MNFYILNLNNKTKNNKSLNNSLCKVFRQKRTKKERSKWCNNGPKSETKHKNYCSSIEQFKSCHGKNRIGTEVVACAQNPNFVHWPKRIYADIESFTQQQAIHQCTLIHSVIQLFTFHKMHSVFHSFEHFYVHLVVLVSSKLQWGPSKVSKRLQSIHCTGKKLN